MGKIKEAEPVKLICGLIYDTTDRFESVIADLEKKFGPIECESEQMPFTHTEYYSEEMGDELFRSFVSFEKMINPGRLKDIKHFTNELEIKNLGSDGGRTVNIDPGIVTLSSLILASTKDFSHRIYIGDGIYGEVTLLYENKAFNSLKWTYPDYKTPIIAEFLIRVRIALMERIIELRKTE